MRPRVVVALAVAGAVVLGGVGAFWLLVPAPSPASSSCGAGLCGAPPLAIGTITESSAGDRSDYNFTLQSVNFHLEFWEVQIQVCNSTGVALVPNDSWELTAVQAAEPPATYSFVSANWTNGALLPVLSGGAWSLSVGGHGGLSDRGDELVFLLRGGDSGTVIASIA